MAYNTHIQNTGNSDFLAKFQHANGGFTNQSSHQHFVPYNVQGQVDVCPSTASSLPPRMQHGISIPQKCQPNFSNVPVTVATNYQSQQLFQSDGFKSPQNQAHLYLHPRHQPIQNMQLFRPSSSSHQGVRQTAPPGTLHYSPHFALPTNTSSALQASESFQQALQVSEGHRQNSQYISSLYNQNKVATFPIPSNSSLMQSNQQSLESTNYLQPHKTAYHTSNANLIQRLQTNCPPFGNMHTVRSTINNFGHEHQFSSPNMPHAGNLVRTSSNANSLSNSNTCSMSTPQLNASGSSSLQQSKFNQIDGMSNLQGLNNPVSSCGYNMLTDYRDITPAHQKYLKCLRILPNNSTSVTSARDIYPIQNMHTGSINSGPLQVNEHENVIYPGNLNVTDVRPDIINQSNTERSVNVHQKNVDNSLKALLINEEMSVNSNPTGVIVHQSNIKENRSSHWYKYPETKMDSPFTSDMQAMLADCTDYNSTTSETSRGKQSDKFTVQVDPIVYTHTESLSRVINVTSANEIQANSSRKENTAISNSCKSYQSNSETFRSEAPKSVLIKQELSDDISNLNTVKLKDVPSGIDSLKTASLDVSSVAEENCTNISILPKDASVNSTLIGKSIPNVIICTETLPSEKDNPALRYLLKTSDSVKSSLLPCGQEEQPISNVKSLQQKGVSFAKMVDNKMTTNKIESSDHQTNSSNASKKTGSKIESSLVQTASEKKVNNIISNKDVTDISIVAKLPITQNQRLNFSNVSSDMKLSDKHTHISTNQHNISPLSQINISTKNLPSYASTRMGFNIQSSKNSSDVSATTSSANDSTVEKIQHSASSVYAVLEAQEGNEAPAAVVRKVTDSVLIKGSILQDAKPKDHNIYTVLPASVGKRRHTSPLPDKKCPDSGQETLRPSAQRKVASRLSLDVQKLQSKSVAHVQDQERHLENQNKSNDQQNVSTPKFTNTSTGSEKLQSELLKKKAMTAKEKVFNLWKSGHISGKKSGAGKGQLGTAVSRTIKRSNNSTNPEAEPKKGVALKVTNTRKEFPVGSTPSVSQDSTEQEGVQSTTEILQMDKPSKLNCAIIYIMLHGHKLICLKSDTESLILLCQFLYECFPNTGLGSVNNCINRFLQINKMPLNHPEKERIIMFLKTNGYQVEDCVQTISVNDAKNIYHHMFEITNCTNKTCVVELPDSTVDLDVSDSTSGRTRTREIMLRLANNVETTLHPGSPGSDHTVAYGKDGEYDTDDVALVIVVEGDNCIYWSPGTPKVGGLSKTLLGQLRCYRHNNENYVVVDDLCTVLGATKFYHGVMEGNITLYSCCQEIANFLNTYEHFAPVKSLNNSLVKASAIGINETVTAESDSKQNDSSLCKRTLCKEEDEDCSSSKQARLDSNVILSKACGIKSVKNCHQFSEIRVIRGDSGSDCNFACPKENLESELDRAETAMEITDIVIQDNEDEISTGESGLSSTMDNSMSRMSLPCQYTKKYLCSIDSQPMQESLPRDLTNTLYINNEIMVFSKDDIARVRSDACSSPCSLKSSASLGEPFTHCEVNNSTLSPIISNDKPDQISCKSLFTHKLTTSDDSLKDQSEKMLNKSSGMASDHISAQKPKEYTVLCEGHKSSSYVCKHPEITCSPGKDSLSATPINSLPECFKESVSEISSLGSENSSLTGVHKSNNLIEFSKDAFGRVPSTSSTKCSQPVNMESNSSLASRPQLLRRPKAIDDIDVVNCSSTGMFIPACGRKACTKLWEDHRALLDQVDELKKRLKRSETSKDEISEYYEALVLEMTRNYKNGDIESVDC